MLTLEIVCTFVCGLLGSGRGRVWKECRGYQNGDVHGDVFLWKGYDSDERKGTKVTIEYNGVCDLWRQRRFTRYKEQIAFYIVSVCESYVKRILCAL